MQRRICTLRAVLALCFTVAATCGAEERPSIQINWSQTVRRSVTVPTLQVVVNPLLRRGSPIHDRAFEELRRLGADYVRYVPWLPYPRLAVPELRAPDAQQTYWDFSLIDPMTVDFLEATKRHPVMVNFSTIPAWMFKTPEPVQYPNDPNEVFWDYTQGTELRDPSGKELGEYYARLVSWYTKGGFRDEQGVWHRSGHRYTIDYWEFLNEIEFEHATTPEQYTARYDAIVSAVRKVAPKMKFVGLALARPGLHPRMFEHFLNPKNHRPGIPVDMISYHFYAVPAPDQPMESWAYTFFEQANHFLETVRYVENIRQRLSPQTRTAINEIGAVGADGEVERNHKPIPDTWWHLVSALYAYLYGNLATLGIDVAAVSQLVGYPTQFPSVTMLDWETGAPNARFRALELMKKHFGPGGEVVETSSGNSAVYAQAFRTGSGERKVLTVNMRDRVETVSLGAQSAWECVDRTTGARPPAIGSTDSLVQLNGFAVCVLTLR